LPDRVLQDIARCPESFDANYEDILSAENFEGIGKLISNFIESLHLETIEPVTVRADNGECSDCEFSLSDSCDDIPLAFQYESGTDEDYRDEQDSCEPDFSESDL
jgi:hypothetical protein